MLQNVCVSNLNATKDGTESYLYVRIYILKYNTENYLGKCFFVYIFVFLCYSILLLDAIYRNNCSIQIIDVKGDKLLIKKIRISKILPNRFVK